MIRIFNPFITFTWSTVLFLTILISSCSNIKIPTHSEVANSWVGFHLEGLKEHWGEPTRALVDPYGRGVYVYEISRTKKLPNITKYVGDKLYTFPAATTVETCNTYFETDSNGIIVKATYEGNACP